MAKLIKRGNVDLDERALDATPERNAFHRKPIIDRDTYEARSEAQQIRERAQAQAEELIAEAQAEAEKIVANAQAEAAQITEEAGRRGYEEGKAQGAAELMEVIARASQRMQQIEAQAVPQLKQLALTIARKILGKELEFHPESVINIVKQALADKARQRREVFLRVNPEDLKMIRAHKAELLEALSRAKEIGIREDPDVQRHGVIIETDAGTIDAQLETQLGVFEQVLKQVR